VAARRLLANLEELAAGTGLVLVVAITIYNIVNRYVLRQSGVWAPELAGMIFAWVVFLGAAAAYKRQMHISISVVVRYLPARLQVAVAQAGGLLLAAFLAYVTYLAFKITLSSHSRLSPVMRVPFSYVYASATIGFALMFVHQVAALARPRSPAPRQPGGRPMNWIPPVVMFGLFAANIPVAFAIAIAALVLLHDGPGDPDAGADPAAGQHHAILSAASPSRSSSSSASSSITAAWAGGS